MRSVRTDLALEAREIFEESADEQTRLEGVEATERDEDGVKVTTVRVLDERGESALKKPVGNYVTLELPEDGLYGDAFKAAAQVLKRELLALLPDGERTNVLVAGLGNPAITPDAVGAKTTRSVVVTRHLTRLLPDQFGEMRPVSAIETGVLGTTGVESAEIIKAMTEKTSPQVVIVIDALASRRLSRVCTTIQLTDTGIVPGSGVGNSRAAINRETLGVQVIAVGVPTVVDAATLAADVLECSGLPRTEPQELSKCGSMMVTPRDIDSKTETLSKLIALGLNMALQKDMTPEEIAYLLD